MQKYNSLFLLVGNGCRGYEYELDRFILKYKIPTMATWRAMDIIPNNHLYFKGRPGNIAIKEANVLLQECEILLIIGARLDMLQVGWNYDNFAPKAIKIVCDIDQSELDKYPDSWNKYCKDAGKFIKELT